MCAAPKGFKQFDFPTRGGQSADIYKQLATGVSGGLPDVLQQLMGQAKGDTSAFEPFEQQAMNQFNQEIAPGIAQRYAGAGMSGSSGLQNSLAGAGGNLAQSLASKRNDIMQKSIMDVLGLGDMLLGKPDIEPYFQKKQSGGDWWNKALGIGLPILGGVAGGVFGGPGGAVAGASLGNSLASGFNGNTPGQTDWQGISQLPTKWSTSQAKGLG